VVRALTALPQYTWEIVVVDDGSPDATAEQVRLATAELGSASPSAENPVAPPQIRLVRHVTNQGLGGALRTGFANTRGVVVVVLDSDLSYHEGHIAELVGAWEQSRAHVVIASPYMDGGSSHDVPPVLDRRSRAANRILSVAALDDVKTLTGMVRAYDGAFVRGLSLKAVDVDINVEILYKTQLLRGTIVEIPGRLDWSQLGHRAGRSGVLSSRGRWNTAKSLVLAYLFRPFWVPMVPAALFAILGVLCVLTGGFDRHDLGAACLVLTVTSVTSALSMLQAKRYFEELYFQGTRLTSHSTRDQD
jgi:glycosyltransferase involved in cell wall biosynthesis